MKKILVLLMLTIFATAEVDLNVTSEDRQEILNFQDFDLDKDGYDQGGCFC